MAGAARMNRCFYCGLPMQRTSRRQSKFERTIDHLTPISRGGKNRFHSIVSGSASNIVYCHRKCNEDKANRTLEEYRIVIAARKGVDPTRFKFSGELP